MRWTQILVICIPNIYTWPFSTCKCHELKPSNSHVVISQQSLLALAPGARRVSAPSISTPRWKWPPSLVRSMGSRKTCSWLGCLGGHQCGSDHRLFTIIWVFLLCGGSAKESIQPRAAAWLAAHEPFATLQSRAEVDVMLWSSKNKKPTGKGLFGGKLMEQHTGNHGCFLSNSSTTQGHGLLSSHGPFHKARTSLSRDPWSLQIGPLYVGFWNPHLPVHTMYPLVNVYILWKLTIFNG